jgi:membrane protease YdiL (CAAX protease family)
MAVRRVTESMLKSGRFLMNKMNCWKTILFFGLPGIAIFTMFSSGLPVLLNAGLALHWSVFFSIWGPVLLLFAIVIIFWKKSGEPLDNYLWISKITGKQLLIVLGAFLVAQILETLLGFSRPILAELPGFHVPSYFPEMFKPDFKFAIPLTDFMGFELPGNYTVLAFWALWLLVNVVGEELLWRAYALPRMEKYFGKWAWLVNGLLWNIGIHFFIRWSFITLLPVSLIVPYLSQKYKSWIPGLIIHGLGNFLFYIFLIPSVLQ